MRYTKGFIGGSLIATLALSAAPAFASDFTSMDSFPVIQINESGFGSAENTAVHLYKLGGNVGSPTRDLFAVTDNANGIQVWEATNTFGTEWIERTDSKLSLDGTQTSVVAIRAFQNHVYVLLNASNGFQLWRWERHGGWKVTLEHAGDNMTGTALDVMNGKITVAYTSTDADGDSSLYASENGKSSWDQVGDSGLDLNVESIVGMEMFNGVGYAITDDNRVLSIDSSGTVTQVADLSDQVTALSTIQSIGKDNRAIMIGGQSDAGAVVLTSTDGSTWNSVVADGFGDAANTTVSHFRLDSIRKSVQAFTENENGFQVWETSATGDFSTWVAFRDSGAVDSDNTSVVDTIKYRGRVYTSTVNSTDGGQVYITQVRPPKVQVESPAFGVTVVGSSTVTVSGTAQAGNRITIRHAGEEFASTTADENGDWSVELTDLTEGRHGYNVFAQYQSGNEVSGRLSRVSRINFFVAL